MILLVSEGSPGAGPPPVFLCAFFCWFLLGSAEEPSPFLFYFVDGSAGYTHGINRLCFSFGFISNIVSKLALQDAFICLHVFCNYCQLSGSKTWFPFPFLGTVSGCSPGSMFTQIQKNFVLYFLHSALTTGSPRALHSISRQTSLSCGNPLCWLNSVSGNLFLFLV